MSQCLDDLVSIGAHGCMGRTAWAIPMHPPSHCVDQIMYGIRPQCALYSVDGKIYGILQMNYEASNTIIYYFT